MYNDLYCKIFVDTDMVYSDLFELILDYANGKKKAIDYIITDWCDISVRKNKEYKTEKNLIDYTDFLYWKYYLDIDPLNIDENQYINNITILFKFLKEHCRGVIIACDFKDEVNGEIL